MELLVRVVDKPRSGVAELDAKRTSAGDVIAYFPDGHQWGREELSNPDWRIVRVPGLSDIEAEALLTPELPTAFGAGRLLRKRHHSVDLAALAALAGVSFSSARTAKRGRPDAVVATGHLKQNLSLKPALRDPRLVGPRVRRIGG